MTPAAGFLIKDVICSVGKLKQMSTPRATSGNFRRIRDWGCRRQSRLPANCQNRCLRSRFPDCCCTALTATLFHTRLLTELYILIFESCNFFFVEEEGQNRFATPSFQVYMDKITLESVISHNTSCRLRCKHLSAYSSGVRPESANRFSAIRPA